MVATPVWPQTSEHSSCVSLVEKHGPAMNCKCVNRVEKHDSVGWSNHGSHCEEDTSQWPCLLSHNNAFMVMILALKKCDSPPVVLRMAVLIPLPHMRHAHVRVEPMNFTSSQLAKAQTKAGHTPHLVDVHDLLYNALKNTCKNLMTTL